MSSQTIIRAYLEAPMLKSAREGSFNFLNVLKSAVESTGWRLEWHLTGPDARAEAPELDGYALFHAEAPTHDRALTFRRAYHYPFWQIETVQQRWRFDVARSDFDPASIDPDQAREFADRLRERVLPGPPPRKDGSVLVPLQGELRRCRSFQTMSPVDMLEVVAATGERIIATLHPDASFDIGDMDALQPLLRKYPNLKFAPKSQPVLRDCSLVATQNSAVAFDGYLLGKPAVLFAQIDFHHIGLNVAELGHARAIELAKTHNPDFDRYIYWFLEEKAINATLPDAETRILAAMRRGGWPI
ncbi:hypothetical protein [Paracoccus aestuariivivens]|uniref:Uncharacterized protein n=1 Tax=Paracoccus aestuariivivens TaxID=1820333 RepID=A0A6L6JDK4_9RHOB|nr:hypothetical protein [Paracoccus aestuariivivens]MTH78244.1 hypothetical protein [Paracoccus aestuariivivens]